jgi:predicted Zn-dependent protease
VKPQPRVSVAALLSQVSRGYYLIDAPAPGRFDLEADRFELPVRGFALEAGRARASVSGALLTGTIASLLHGIQAVARDLELIPLDGMIGSPTLLVTGIEIAGGG